MKITKCDQHGMALSVRIERDKKASCARPSLTFISTMKRVRTFGRRRRHGVALSSVGRTRVANGDDNKFITAAVPLSFRARHAGRTSALHYANCYDGAMLIFFDFFFFRVFTNGTVSTVRFFARPSQKPKKKKCAQQKFRARLEPNICAPISDFCHSTGSRAVYSVRVSTGSDYGNRF